MQIHSKATLTLLALALGVPLAFGQSATPAPAPPSPGINAQAPHTPMHMRQNDSRSQWNHGRAWHGRDHWRGRQWRGREHRQFMLARMVRNPSFRERLGITPEQAMKIRTQTSDFRKDRIRNQADLQIKHLELRDLLSADNPNRTAIDSKLQEISSVRLAQEKAAINFRLNMRAALTSDQQQKLRQMRRESFHHRNFGSGGPNGVQGNMPPQTNG